MRTLTVRALVNKRGLVTLEMPKEYADQQVDLVIVYEQVTVPAEGEQSLARNWPSEFFAATAGAWQGEPLLREQPGEYETRDPLP